MADFSTCKQDLLLNLRARVPFICLKTDERARGLELFHDVSKDLNAPIYYRTPSQGMSEVARQILQRENLTFVLTEFAHLESNNRTTRQILSLVTSAIDHGGVICVIAPDPIWRRLQRMGILLSLDPPNQDEMTTIIGEFLDQHGGNVSVEWGPAELEHAGLIMAGFTRLEAENRLLRLVANGSVLRSDLAALAQTKDRMLADIAGLERVPVLPKDLCVGGLAGLNDWLRTRQPLLSMDLRGRGLRQPRGVLMVGVPGCGKSLSARLIAATWKMALYRLDLTRIHRAYLDHPEQGLKEALTTVDRHRLSASETKVTTGSCSHWRSTRALRVVDRRNRKRACRQRRRKKRGAARWPILVLASGRRRARLRGQHGQRHRSTANGAGAQRSLR